MQTASTISGASVFDGPSVITRSLTVQCTPRYVNDSNFFDSASSLSVTPMSHSFEEAHLLRDP